MPSAFTQLPNLLRWRRGHHVLEVQPWGPDSARVRAGVHRVADGLPGALDPEPATPSDAAVEVQDTHAVLTNGLLRITVRAADGLLSATRTDTGL